jgi:hypothetical protein
MAQASNTGPAPSWGGSSRQRSAQPKAERGKVAASWGTVSLATLLYWGAAAALVLLLGFASVVWLLPPWVAFFNSATSGAAEAGLIPRLWYPFFASMAPWAATLAFIAAQFYQSLAWLSYFGVIPPASAHTKTMRTSSYVLEAFIVSIAVFGTLVGGWKGGGLTWLIQLLAVCGRNPFAVLGALFSVATQTMIAEIIIHRVIVGVRMAIEATAKNAKKAIEIGNVQETRSASWGSSNKSAWESAAKNDPAKSADVKSDQPKELTRQTWIDANRDVLMHGQIVFTPGDKKWSWIEIDANGVPSIKPISEGTKKEFNGIRYIAKRANAANLNGEFGYYWEEILSAPKNKEPREQRRGATEVEEPITPDSEPLNPAWEVVGATTVGNAQWAASQAKQSNTDRPGTFNSNGQNVGVTQQQPAPPKRLKR